MLKESRLYRRTQRRSAMSEHEKWRECEHRKSILADTARSSAEYEAGVRRICDELGI